MGRETEQNLKLQRSALVRKRKRRRRTVSLTLILLLLGVALITINVIFFKINTIKVENSITSTYTGEQIIQASGLSKGQNLFSFRKNNVQTEILKKLPYIGSVKISRRLPNTVVLIISEKTDFVSIPYRGGYLIVSTDLKILSDTFIQQEGIPTVYGIVPTSFNPGEILTAKDEGSLEALKAILLQLDKYKWVDKVSAINVKDKLDVYMVYESRVLVRFGSIAKLDYKFDLLLETISNKLSIDFKGNINLSTSKYVYVSEGEMRFPAGFFDIGLME